MGDSGGKGETRRRRAREAALQILYQLEVRGVEVLNEMTETLAEVDDRAHAERIVRGVHAGRAAIDETIRRAAVNWDLERMSVVDRNLLRMGVYELADCPDVPPRVVLDEAIDLAKRYGGADSYRFVNGVLDRIARESRGAGPLPA